MVLGSNPTTNDTLNLLGASCCGVVNTSRFGSPWRVLRAWPWRFLGYQKKKIKIKIKKKGKLDYYSFVLVYEDLIIK